MYCAHCEAGRLSWLTGACCRANGIAWGDDDLALLYQSWWKTRRSLVHWFRPGHLEEEKHLLFDRNYEDAYNGGHPMGCHVRFSCLYCDSMAGELWQQLQLSA